MNILGSLGSTLKTLLWETDYAKLANERASLETSQAPNPYYETASVEDYDLSGFEVSYVRYNQADLDPLLDTKALKAFLNTMVRVNPQKVSISISGQTPYRPDGFYGEPHFYGMREDQSGFIVKEYDEDSGRILHDTINVSLQPGNFIPLAHEFGHLLDRQVNHRTPLSNQEDFFPLYNSYRDHLSPELEADPYATKSDEIFARLFAAWYRYKFPDNPYTDEPAHTYELVAEDVMNQIYEQVDNYFSTQFPEIDKLSHLSYNELAALDHVGTLSLNDLDQLISQKEGIVK